MSSESRGSISTDSRQVCLASLADAADALAQAAATLAAAARATIQAFSTPTLASPEVQENPGINLGKGADDVHVPVMGDDEANQGPDPGVGGSGGEHGETAQTDLLSTRTNTPKVLVIENPRDSLKNQSYRLLVDNEADVILFACALIDKRQRAICYLPYDLPPLKTYKLLIETVTETPVYILDSSKQDGDYAGFLLENPGSVLLVPETLLPNLELEGENSWVIHIGWPASEVKYIAQRKTHRAQNNILVAHFGDQSLYPSGDSIINLTEPWPKDGTSFRESVSILRPLYEVVLSEISLEMKMRVYLDWIRMHAAHGPRHIKTWTVSMMVQHANAYLLEVLQWSGPHTGGDVPLPEVSAEFVAQNNLQLAVQEGILRVEDDLDPPASTPSLPDRLELTPTQTEFQLAIGHTYFALAEEFDAIPLACFISEKYDRVICFLEGHVAVRHYQKLFAKITGRHVISTTLNNDQAVGEAVQRFFSATPPVILLLAYTTINLPATLKEGSIDCCIYWGHNSPLKQAKKHRSLINCATTIIIMAAPQEKSLVTGSSDIKKHPSASIPLDLTENSLLAPMRNRTRLALTSDSILIRELYTNRVYGVGAIPRVSLSAEDAARRANQYAARILLHGDPADGSGIFPPVAGRPSVPRIAVEKFKLQPAVDAVATCHFGTLVATHRIHYLDRQTIKTVSQFIMLPGLLDNICPGGLRVERLSSLAHAAECLAIAANTLSEAARAAAESLTLDSTLDTKQDDSESNNLKAPTPDLPTFPPLNLILLNPPPDSITLPTEPEQNQPEEEKEITELLEEGALEDPIVRIENKGQLAGKTIEMDEDLEVGIDMASLGVEYLQEPSNIRDTHACDEPPVEIGPTNLGSGDSDITTGTEGIIDPKQPYRVLVENELDVLLSACALIGKNQRVICYMPCGTPPLSFYKRLIEGVTGTSVYFAERMSAAKRDAAYEHSLQNGGSVVLMPSTLSSDVVMEGDDSWVIHIGWPSNRERYLSQIKNHQAKNNVIVACSEDLDLYPSCAPLVDLTQDWPKFGNSLTASVNALRQSFELTLAEISDEVKEKVYPDWIQSHGVYGPRYVKSWDSTMLVLQANHYLLYVLKYRCKSIGSDTTGRRSLPEVSPGFVAQNLLESAVQAGALLVKRHDSGLNHISSFAQMDFKSPTPAIADVNTSTAGTSVPGLLNRSSSGDRVRRRNTASSAETLSEQVNFKLTPGHTYFTIDEEFDAIPLMCFISEKYDKTVCFLEGQGSLRHYQRLFNPSGTATHL
ncbi:hypothetical protein FRC11_014182 [Ceratobasidium sp. 423]|nr:hypothetical protein FRC11_014182 [Ceratobasidium sp. 423]